ncbi:MAG: O-antigen ligase family protein [Candidatus Eremiobacteraeota bacterium]|nr:O-antigen ligase family protein [Candidatus Eremiobacteraeota bacterium]
MLLLAFLAPWPSPEMGWLLACGLLFVGAAELRVSLHRPVLWIFAWWCVGTSFWSAAPRALEGSLAQVGCLWLGCCLAHRYSVVEILGLLSRMLALVVACHLVVVLFWPQLGMDSHGHWKGLTDHKNALAPLASLAVALGALAPSTALGLPLRSLLLLGGGLLLVGADSATPVLALAGMLVAAGLLKLFDRSRGKALGVALLLALGTALNWRSVLAWVGRDPFLTGRVNVWRASLRYFADAPVVGHGFGQFECAGFPGTLHPHHGLLLLLVSTGLVGCLLFLVDFSWVGLQAARRLSQGFELSLGAPICFLVFWVILNQAEILPPFLGLGFAPILYAVASEKLVVGNQLMIGPTPHEAGHDGHLGQVDA